MHAVRERFDARRILAKHVAKTSAKMTQSNDGRLFDYLSGDRISLNTIVSRREGIDCALERAEGRVMLRFYDKLLSFPDSVGPAIDCVLKRMEFSVKEVQANLSDAGKLTIIRRLVKEGLLRIQSCNSD